MTLRHCSSGDWHLEKRYLYCICRLLVLISRALQIGLDSSSKTVEDATEVVEVIEEVDEEQQISDEVC